MVRRWLALVVAVALPSLLAACAPRGAGNAPGPSVQREASTRRAAELRRLAEARARAERQRLRERCLRERPGLETGMAALRRAESRLARVKEEGYAPLPPPPPWDEAAEARFRQEDRDADWLRHQREREAWREGEGIRRARWWSDHQARLGEAQAELNAAARSLRERRPDLFTGPGSIEFNPAVAEQIRTCADVAAQPAGQPAVQAVGKTAPP
ncbi:MAG: hypothetical protein VKO26_01615 [Cyanobacteriota bacterium]|nr:hypothetical protein [Cyanobacteriota bacterium]